MLVVTLIVATLFVWTYLTARAEPPSYDSGNNLAVTSLMALIIFILASFVSFQTIIDEQYLLIKFCCGIYQKKFLLNQIVSVDTLKNPSHFGWIIGIWLWPKGFIVVEIKLKNGKKYLIGSTEPDILKQAINNKIYPNAKI